MSDLQISDPFGPDYIPPTEAELKEYNDLCRASVTASMRDVEYQYRGDFTLAWIDTEPAWVSACEWSNGIILDDPKTLCSRTIRFSLIGGGQIKVTEELGDYFRCLSEECYYRRGDPDLVVTAHLDASHTVVRYKGKLIRTHCYEMDAHAVVFPTPGIQDIADRTAATLRAIEATPDNFYALLAASKRCAFCNRPLKDEVSKLIGVGPDCAEQNRIPHSMKAASARLALRQKLLDDSHNMEVNHDQR
jgi:hypothetical protein